MKHKETAGGFAPPAVSAFNMVRKLLGLVRQRLDGPIALRLGDSGNTWKPPPLGTPSAGCRSTARMTGWRRKWCALTAAGSCFSHHSRGSALPRLDHSGGVLWHAGGSGVRGPGGKNGSRAFQLFFQGLVLLLGPASLALRVPSQLCRIHAMAGARRCAVSGASGGGCGAC